MREKKKSISSSLAKMTVIPILFLGIITSIFGIFWVKSSMESEVEHELCSNAHLAVSAFDDLYPGDYAVDSSSETLQVTKGDTILNSNYFLLDSMKKASETDYTLFLSNVRILTTLTSDEDVRIIGTEANFQIKEDVLEEESDHFYKSIDVFGKKYYAYYTPIYNSDKQCVGMMGAVMPEGRVISIVTKTILPIIVILVISIAFAIFWAIHDSKDIKNAIIRLNGSLKKVAQGTLSNTVAPDLLARKDEIGDMAHSAVDMQAALRKLVDEDMLTGLTNRRSGQIRLSTQFEQNQGSSDPFCLALGDIDFFKKFNDTHGHDCGDLVLKNVAATLKDSIKDYGICARWGGEEFLIIFTRGTKDEIKEVMEATLDAIRNMKVNYQGKELSVTMTFGLIDSTGAKNEDEMVKKVDELLYHGKENGRNQLVV